MSSRYVKGDPRAIANGRKGGKVRRAKRSAEYVRGYRSGHKAGCRQAREWITAMRTRQGETA